MTIEYKYATWMEILTTEYNNGNKYTFLLCQNEKVLGYCTVGRPSGSSMKKINSELAKDKNNNFKVNGELYTMYLSPQCPKRQGHGTMLFEFAYKFICAQFNLNDISKHENIKTPNNTIMSLWALYDNTIAMNFYKKHKCIVITDDCKARFGDTLYRYCGLITSNHINS